MAPELYWDDAEVGDECTSPSVTVTEAMVNTCRDDGRHHSGARGRRIRQDDAVRHEGCAGSSTITLTLT